MEFGDFTITLVEMSHPTFKRNKNDLSMVINLNLTESLCGFRKIIKTLDNRQLLINSELGKVYSNGDTNYIMNEGMPIYQNQMQRGNLVINFEVSMPETILLKHVPLIEKILPQREKLPSIDSADGVKYCSLISMDLTEENVEPQETPYYNQQNQFDTNQEFPTHDYDSQDQYPSHEYREYEYQNEHYHGAQYQQEAPYERDDNEQQSNDHDNYYNQQGYDHNEHYYEPQYHQEEPYDEARRSSPESLESYHQPR